MRLHELRAGYAEVSRTTSHVVRFLIGAGLVLVGLLGWGKSLPASLVLFLFLILAAGVLDLLQHLVAACSQGIYVQERHRALELRHRRGDPAPESVDVSFPPALGVVPAFCWFLKAAAVLAAYVVLLVWVARSGL